MVHTAQSALGYTARHEHQVKRPQMIGGPGKPLEVAAASAQERAAAPSARKTTESSGINENRNVPQKRLAERTGTVVSNGLAEGKLGRKQLKQALKEACREQGRDLHAGVRNSKSWKDGKLGEQDFDDAAKKIVTDHFKDPLTSADLKQARDAFIKGVCDSTPKSKDAIAFQKLLVSRFEKAFDSALAEKLEEKTRPEAAKARAMLDKECTCIETWHGEHALARASSKPIEEPGRFKVNFSILATQRGKVEHALSEALRFKEMSGDGNADMRPLMYAGLRLAQACGGDGIKPKDAIALLESVCQSAGDRHGKTPLSPEDLRPFVAGMTSLWPQDVSNEVALDFLSQFSESTAEKATPPPGTRCSPGHRHRHGLEGDGADQAEHRAGAKGCSWRRNWG